MKILFLLLVGVSVGFPVATAGLPVAVAGTEISGGGGNGAVAEFLRLGTDSLHTLANRSDTLELTRNFDPGLAARIFATTRVESTKEDLTLLGQDVTAINYPGENRIVFEEHAWARLDKTGKLQLVLHEIVGLTHRKAVNDGDYRVSKALTELTLRTGVENVALALALANSYQSERPRVQTNRTKVVGPYTDWSGDDGIITEVYVQTFENASPQAVRIYRVYEDATGGVVKVEMVGAEGPVGP